MGIAQVTQTMRNDRGLADIDNEGALEVWRKSGEKTGLFWCEKG
jgi:hypothetical protein